MKDNEKYTEYFTNEIQKLSDKELQKIENVKREIIRLLPEAEKLEKIKLTDKQKEFAEQFLLTGQISESMLKAGYKGKRLGAMGSRNLKNPNIVNYLRARLATKNKNTIADQTEVLEFLTAVMRGQVTEEVIAVTQEGVERVEKTADVKDRITSAKELGRRYVVVDAEFKKQIALRKIELEEKRLELAAKQFEEIDEGIEYIVEES